ncbi:sulfite exporter TauE/SafE family protein [Labilibaculum sp.]|uniref:sulfite exporter TauE/SafE family protein n=1 Tax=Labilibaculum sp. TaxID=2060723 RepID=UPI002AA705CC|nr:sulfite exporter TauE/SafE family protein [Labilibaculum sp.]
MAELFANLQEMDIYSFPIICLLLLAGFAVGFINTIAGSGTVISYSLFMLLGLSAPFANGTIRFGVIMQTLVASYNFKKQNVLELKKGILLALPTVLGSVLGAQIAININKDLFEILIAGVMLTMGLFLFFKPNQWLAGSKILQNKQFGSKQFTIFFAIGIYGGFIHIGVGIFLIGILVLEMGYDLIKANALKVFIVLLYSPFALIVFMMNDQIHYGIGAIAAIGNIFGGYTASHFAVNWGANFIRWILMLIILIFGIQSLNLFNL